GMSRPAGGPIHRSSRMAPDRCSVWLNEDIRIRSGSGPRSGSPVTGPTSPRCAPILWATQTAHGPEASRWWHREGRAIMAVAESRPAVPAVVYDVDEAAEALRLSRSVLYELIRSGRLRTVKQGRRRLVPVSALAEYVDPLGSSDVTRRARGDGRLHWDEHRQRWIATTTIGYGGRGEGGLREGWGRTRA